MTRFSESQTGFSCRSLVVGWGFGPGSGLFSARDCTLRTMSIWFRLVFLYLCCVCVCLRVRVLSLACVIVDDTSVPCWLRGVVSASSLLYYVCSYW